MHLASEYVRIAEEEHPFILHNLLPASGAMNIMGAPKMGKSFLALQLAEAIANPERADFLGIPIAAHGRVLYVQLDTSRRIWGKRIRDLWSQPSLFSPSLDFSRVWIIDKEDVPGFDLFNTVDYRWLNYTLQASEINPLVVIFDVLREVYQGNENDNSILRKVISRLEEAVAPAALVVLSHTRKTSSDRQRAEEEEDSMEVNRGSSYLNGRMDALLKLTRNRIFIESRTDERTNISVTQNPSGFWVNIADTKPSEEITKVPISRPNRGVSGSIDTLPHKFGG